jgi:hypothetical protein
MSTCTGVQQHKVHALGALKGHGKDHCTSVACLPAAVRPVLVQASAGFIRADGSEGGGGINAPIPDAGLTLNKPCSVCSPVHSRSMASGTRKKPTTSDKCVLRSAAQP